MKLNELIHRVKKVRSGEYEDTSVSEWITAVDKINKIIYDNIISRHKTESVFAQITSTEDELPIPEEYCDLYLHYILAQTAMLRNETARYNNSMEAFNTLYSRYADYINRTYMPKQNNSINLGVL